MASINPTVILSLPVWDPALDLKVFVGQRDTLRKELEISEGLFGIVTSSFTSQNKPSWLKKVTGSINNDLVGELSTVSTPFVYLVTGTKRRHAILSRDYVKRTVPRKIVSGGRGGKVLARGSVVPISYARRRRIPAGKWDSVIAKQRIRPWARDMFVRLALDTNRLDILITHMVIL